MSENKPSKPNTNAHPAISYIPDPQDMMDVRILAVAQRYPYMFSEPHFDLLISKRWISAFTRTCEGIDALLGEDTRGFHWRLLMKDEGIPHWYWKLGDEFNHSLVLERTLTETKVRIVNPPRDPHNVLRNAIQRVVKQGQMDARLEGEGALPGGDES